MTTILITFSILLFAMLVLNIAIISIVILRFGYDKGMFLRIFIDDLKWTFTQLKIVCMIIFTTAILTAIMISHSNKKKICEYEQHKEVQKCQITK